MDSGEILSKTSTVICNNNREKTFLENTVKYNVLRSICFIVLLHEHR